MFEQDLEEKNIEIENNVDIQPNKESEKELSFVKKLALFLTGCVGFEIIGFIVSLIVVLLVGTDAAQTPEVTGIINFICYGSLFVILVAILNKDIVKLFSSFTKGRNYLFGIVFAALLIGVPIFYNMLINLFRETGTSQNEEGLRSFIVIYPLLSIFILGVVGPFCEELTYRVGLFGLLKKHKWLAYIVSAIVFALMHFTFTAKGEAMIDELLNLPIYLFSGVMFALAYDKFGLSCSLTAHVINNVFAISMTIIASLIS